MSLSRRVCHIKNHKILCCINCYHFRQNCYALVKTVFDEKRSCPNDQAREDCFNSHDILNNDVVLTDKRRLFAISAFFYVSDFANWYLSYACDPENAAHCSADDREYIDSYPKVTPNKYANYFIQKRNTWYNVINFDSIVTIIHLIFHFQGWRKRAMPCAALMFGQLC